LLWLIGFENLRLFMQGIHHYSRQYVHENSFDFLRLASCFYDIQF
jgi:hypothetical protein